MTEPSDIRHLARTLHDTNLALRENRVEIRVLAATVGMLCGWAVHPWWVGALVMSGVFVAAGTSAALLAPRWMKKHGIDWKFDG